VPEGIRFHDAPSKCRIAPALPTAQPLLGFKITREFKLLVVGGDAPTTAADHEYPTRTNEASKARVKGVERNSSLMPTHVLGI
jgi:hypothetical protein